MGHTSLAQVEGEPVQERVRNQLSEEEAEREDDHAGNGEGLQNPHGIPPVLPNATRGAAAAVLPVRALLSDGLDRRRTEADVLGVRREEEKHKSPAERNEPARDDERPSPPVPEHGGGDERSGDVPDGGVRVPYPHDEAAPPAAEPVADDGDDGGPAGGLEQAGDHLGGDVEREGVEAEEVPGAEERDSGAAGGHAEGEEVAEVEAVAEVACDEHAEGVGGEEGDVGGAEERRVGEGRPGPGELALDDAGRLAGGVVERVGEEGEPQDEGAVGVVGEGGQGAEAGRPVGPLRGMHRRRRRLRHRRRGWRSRGQGRVVAWPVGPWLAGKAGREGKKERTWRGDGSRRRTRAQVGCGLDTTVWFLRNEYLP
jgi:hypothetical protein